jgi:hypothetical protein
MIEGGTYSEAVNMTTAPLGAQYGEFSFQTYNGQVVWNGPGYCLHVAGGAWAMLDGDFSLSCVASGNEANCCLLVDGGGTLALGGTQTIFGNCPSCSHMIIGQGGYLYLNPAGGSYTIAGGGINHIEVSGPGVFNAVTWSGYSNTVTLQNTPNFTGAFAYASGGSYMMYSKTFAGTGATGQRYNVSMNGVVNTNGAGASYFPGNAAGATYSGGQYV